MKIIERHLREDVNLQNIESLGQIVQVEGTEYELFEIPGTNHSRNDDGWHSNIWCKEVNTPIDRKLFLPFAGMVARWGITITTHNVILHHRVVCETTCCVTLNGALLYMINDTSLHRALATSSNVIEELSEHVIDFTDTEWIEKVKATIVTHNGIPSRVTGIDPSRLGRLIFEVVEKDDIYSKPTTMSVFDWNETKLSDRSLSVDLLDPYVDWVSYVQPIPAEFERPSD